jgi:hypothetical protein
MNEHEQHGMKVTDKRRFDEKGESRKTEDQVSTTADKSAEARIGEGPKPKAERPKEQEKQELPSIDFITFILSLASSVQVHFGMIPNPATGKAEKNLGLAKQTIDILGVMQEKTKGNLDKQEEQLIESILYELRLKYVELNK